MHEQREREREEHLSNKKGRTDADDGLVLKKQPIMHACRRSRTRDSSTSSSVQHLPASSFHNISL
jgi:hypothetical protein